MVRIEFAGIKLVTGNAHKELAKKVASHLKIPLTPMEVTRFSDGETYVRIDESIRACDVYVIQPTGTPANENLMELLIIIDALRRSSAGRITAVVPYFGYARQDRKANDREAITAKLVANLMATAGVNRVLTVDLHADQLQGFFDIPLDHIKGLPIIAGYLKKKKLKNAVVVSPDFGSIKRSNDLATYLDAPLVIISKRRSRKTHDTIEDMTVLGEVRGKHAIIVDDLISTGSTIEKVVVLLRKHGIQDVYVGCTHAVLVGRSVEILTKAKLKELIVTDTLPISKEKRISTMVELSVAPWIAETIKCIHSGQQMGTLFDTIANDYIAGKRS